VDPAVIVTLVISVAGVIFASITAPLILAHRTERMHREDMLSDYQRQDKVAAAAKAATEAAQMSAAAIKEHTEVTVVKLDDANQKLDVIHGLVNSNMSGAMQSELDALVTSAAMMREVIDLKRAARQEPSEEAVKALHDTEAKIAKLRVAMNDRLKQAETIASRAAEAAAAATLASEAAEKKAVPRS
jgi:hypothetical protein